MRETHTAPSGQELPVGFLPFKCHGCEGTFMVEDGPECPCCGHDHRDGDNDG